MAWTKQQLVLAAFSKIGYGALFDVAPEQIEDASQKMDAMAAAWTAIGIRIGYNLSDNPSVAKSTDSSGVVDAANEVLFMNLAKRLAGEYGKTMQASDLAIAKAGYDTLLNKVVSRSVVPMQYPIGLPRGAGNKAWRNNRPFVTEPQETLDVGPDSSLILE